MIKCCKIKEIKIEHIYNIECLIYHYEKIKQDYQSLSSRTRYRAIPLPKTNKRIFKKNSIYTAIKIFNMLPNELKNYNISNRNKKKG